MNGKRNMQKLMLTALLVTMLALVSSIPVAASSPSVGWLSFTSIVSGYAYGYAGAAGPIYKPEYVLRLNCWMRMGSLFRALWISPALARRTALLLDNTRSNKRLAKRKAG
jgi:hypothetical protein